MFWLHIPTNIDNIGTKEQGQLGIKMTKVILISHVFNAICQANRTWDSGMTVENWFFAWGNLNSRSFVHMLESQYCVKSHILLFHIANCISLKVVPTESLTESATKNVAYFDVQVMWTVIPVLANENPYKSKLLDDQRRSETSFT